jgi:hypothetical protein
MAVQTEAKKGTGLLLHISLNGPGRVEAQFYVMFSDDQKPYLGEFPTVEAAVAAAIKWADEYGGYISSTFLYSSELSDQSSRYFKERKK